MTPDDIVALATRLRALEQVAYAADIFMKQIKGYRVMGNDGQPHDIFHKDLPQALALQSALDAWHEQQTERQ